MTYVELKLFAQNTDASHGESMMMMIRYVDEEVLASLGITEEFKEREMEGD